MTEAIKVVGRNEPCPCGSGKKYKRCCGVGAAPKLTPPKEALPGSNLDPEVFGKMDPQMLMQMTQAIQRLPKGQIQRLQSIMQKAMSGKDVTAEAQEFEKTLPPDFKEMMKGFSLPAEAGAEASDMGLSLPTQNHSAFSAAEPADTSASSMAPPMTEDEARALVAKAAAEGKISEEQAQTLLKSETDKPGKFGKFWKNFTGKSDK